MDRQYVCPFAEDGSALKEEKTERHWEEDGSALKLDVGSALTRNNDALY